MKKYLKLPLWSNGTGFTLIEIVLVIILLGILAVVAIPRFINTSTAGKQEAEDTVVALVRAGIENVYHRAVTRGTTPWYPPTLDEASNGPASPSNPFFTKVLTQPVTEHWTKNGYAYTGPAGNTYTYNPSTGTFQ